MLFLVLSDSHGRQDLLRRVISSHKDIKHVLFLGDGIAEFSALADEFPDRHFRAVRGNMDAFSLAARGEEEEIFELYGVRVMMAHGHRYGVKGGTAAYEAHAHAHGARVAIYGHTHIPEARYDSETGLYIFNPGSIGRPYHGRPTFGLLDILPDGSVVLSHGEETLA